MSTINHPSFLVNITLIFVKSNLFESLGEKVLKSCGGPVIFVVGCRRVV